jgi:hypothetical protein
MKTRQNGLTLLALLLTLSLSVLLAGCGSDDPASPIDTTATVNEDAAQAVASDVATDSGGVSDQLADLSMAIGGLGGAKSAPDGEFVQGRFRESVYDEITGTWTVTVAREQGFPEGTPYHAMSRVFTLRLLNAAGQPQQYRVVGADTAVTAEYNIVSGTGIHRTQRRTHNLDELSGEFLVTGVNSDMLTINGTYLRGASHSLETPRFSRTLVGVLDVDLIDVTVPRIMGANFNSAVSGTITGTWVADITVTRGDDYMEQHVEREITIVLGDGEAEINCGGGAFRALLGTGEMRR